MFQLPRLGRSASAASTPGHGSLQIALPPKLRSVVDKLGQRWQCTSDETGQRLVLLALTGWKVKYADLIAKLAGFVPGHDDTFLRTCLMLSDHFDITEIELGEAVTELDRVTWLETLLETLEDRRRDGQRSLLSDVVAVRKNAA